MSSSPAGTPARPPGEAPLSGGFSIAIEDHPDRAVSVALAGELDLQRAYSFDEEMRRLEQRRPRLIVLDLRRLGFLDCAGLGRILALHRRARRADIRLVVVRGSKPVRRLFALTAVESVLVQVSDPAEVLGPPRG